MRTETQAETAARLNRALSRFAIAITLLTVVGHAYLGFEQSWLTPLAAALFAYALELGLAALTARLRGSSPPWHFGPGPLPLRLMLFLRAAHISALACAMLLYAAAQLGVILFAVAAAIGLKYVMRVPRPGGRGTVHFLNPSNAGIVAALLVFPDLCGVVPPYQFTAALAGPADWFVPGVILCTGTLLNWKLTRRLPLIVAWVLGFMLQGLLRHGLDGQLSPGAGATLVAVLGPLTGVPLVLFTFYMITDPMTSPDAPSAQVVFGLAVALLYGAFLLLGGGVVFGLFYALALACGARGLWLVHGARIKQLLVPRAAADRPAAVRA